MHGQSRVRRILQLMLAAAPLAWLAVVAHATAAPASAPPTITAVATPAANSNGWNRTNVTVRFTCVAAASTKIASCPAAVVVSTEGANQVVSGTARDKAGNTATTSVMLNIDKTAPVVTASRSPEAAAGAWTTTPVTVTFAATDSLSGLAPDSLTAPVT